MNERIKKLAIQVQRSEMPGVLYAHPEFVEKFAALLIRECAELFPEMAGDLRGTYRDQIYEHFGVS